MVITPLVILGLFFKDLCVLVKTVARLDSECHHTMFY